MNINIAQMVIIIVYLAIVGYLGKLGHKGTKDAGDYLLGGRKIHPVVMALSYGATFISTSAIVGFGGTAGVFGFSLLWLTFLNIFLGVFIAFIFFGKRTRRIGHNMHAHTFPEFLGKRFESKFIQKFAGVVVFIFMPVYTAAVMIGVSKIIEGGLGINYNVALFIFATIVAAYVFFGGIKGVMYSDAFQGGLMLVGMSILIVAIYSQLGGVVTAHQKLTDLFSNPDISEQIAGLQKGGFQGWTSMPKIFSNYWWIVVSSIVMGVGIGVLAQPQLAVRFMTVKSDKELNRAIPIGGVFIFLMTGVAFVVGSLSNVLFFETSGKIAVVAAKGTDGIIPLFLDQYMPNWFVTVFLVVLMAAGMSTISSQFHAMGTAVGRDIFKVDEKVDGRKSLFVTRLGVLVAIIFTIILSYVLPNVWDGAIAISTGLFFGLCASSFLPMYFGALYCKKLSKTAAISGMLAGFGTSLLWMMFIHTKESSVLKVCEALTGKPSLFPESTLQVVDPLIISLTVSILVTIIVQAIAKSKEQDAHIEKCFHSVK